MNNRDFRVMGCCKWSKCILALALVSSWNLWNSSAFARELDLSAVEMISGINTEFVCGTLEFGSGVNFKFLPEPNAVAEHAARKYFYIEQVPRYTNDGAEFAKILHKNSGNRVCIKNFRTFFNNPEANQYTLSAIEGFSLKNQTPSRGWYTANHCEIFIDKLRVKQISRYRRDGSINKIPAVDYFIKIDSSRLDSKIRAVRFQGKSQYANYSTAIRLNPFEGSEDYYWLELEQYSQGDFYVETQSGKRLFIGNPYGQGFLAVFPADLQIYANAFGETSYSGDIEIENLPKTADVFVGINPKKCR